MILTSIPWLPKLYTQSHIYTYIHTHTCPLTYSQTHIYTHTLQYTCIQIHIIHTCTHTYTVIYIHAQIHINTYIHILCKSHYTQAHIQLFQSWPSGFYYFQRCWVIWKFITQSEFLKYSLRTSKIRSSDGPLWCVYTSSFKYKLLLDIFNKNILVYSFLQIFRGWLYKSGRTILE